MELRVQTLIVFILWVNVLKVVFADVLMEFLESEANAGVQFAYKQKDPN